MSKFNYYCYYHEGQQICILKESKQYVQGVSWDPVGKFVVTLSNDRYVPLSSPLKEFMI